MNRKCWCVTTKGMHAVGQVEVVVLLQCLPEEKSFPKDIFSHFVQLYRDTLTGWTALYTVLRLVIISYFLFCRNLSCSTCLDSLRKDCATSVAVPVRWQFPGQRRARRLSLCPLHLAVPPGSTSAQPALPLWPAGAQSGGGLGESLSSASHAAIRSRVQM